MEYYNNQISTAEEINPKFSNHSRYQMLLAEMQSGKSGTYLYLACLMIDEGKVDNVYIITGNRILGLKTQCFSDKKLGVEGYLFKKAETVSADVRQKLSENITVNWGQDLDKSPLIPKRSLIIWDESHHAQQNENKPFEFFMKNGIHKALVGDNACLEEKEIYILSVSATPFAELAANIRTSRQEWDDIPADLDFQLSEKNVTVMMVPPQYFSVNFYFENGRVQPSFCLYDEKRDDFKNLMASYMSDKGYFIIRSCEDLDDKSIIKSVCSELNIPIEYDYGNSQSALFRDEAYPYEGLKTKPEQFTVVHIKGKMRMGQVVPKVNILGVFESSKKPNIDCVLQSLFGRMCGYSNSKDPFDPRKIDIFIPSSSIPLAREYGRLMKERKVNELVMKITRASCVVGREKPSTHTAGWYPIIPVYIPKFLFTEIGIQAKNIHQNGMLSKLKEIIQENNLLRHQNSLQRNEIMENFLKSGVGDGRNLVLKSYSLDFKLPQILMKGYKSKCHVKTNQDNFIRDYCDEKPRQLSFFSVDFNDSQFLKYDESQRKEIKLSFQLLGINQGDAFMIGYTRAQSDELKTKYDAPLPRIHEKCDFHPLSALLTPTQVPENHNGCQVIFASPKTYNNIGSFRKWLRECVMRSKKNKDKEGSWNSVADIETQEIQLMLLKKSNFMKKKNQRFQLTNVITDIEKISKCKINIDFADDIFSQDGRNIQIKQITWTF